MAEPSDVLPFDVRYRFRQLVVKPLSTPFLPLFGITKMAEPGANVPYWTKFTALTAGLFVVGNRLLEMAQEVTDDDEN